jgi:hypothetical protein
MQPIQDRFTDSDQLHRENRLRACNRAVADLHEEAISSLMGEEEYDAVRLWKEALQLINITASPSTEAPWSGPDSLTEKVNAGSAPNAFTQEGSRIDSQLMHPLSAPPSGSRCLQDFPTTIFRLADLVVTDNSYSARAMNDVLATIVVYHIAVSLHRIAILRNLECLLSQSLKLYELACMALNRCELSLSAVDAQALTYNILENILTIFSSPETAPSA